MPKTRKSQVSLQNTPYYHCVSKCVRGSFLCGIDSYTGNSYEHRRGWVEERLLWLSSIFAIDVCAYAVTSNYVHLVMCVDKDKALSWTNKEVSRRWHQLHKGTLLSQKFARNEVLSDSELISLKETLVIYRKRLYKMSWIIGDLNEHIARQANKEDGCTGRFWEGRFKSQALLDESVVLACMAYADLNPIRSKMANAPQISHHTSIKQQTPSLRAKMQFDED